MDIETTDIGFFGTGSRILTGGLVHSSGAIYLGTYGPTPAVIWKHELGSGRLTKIAEPGEYQLRQMVEAPDGMIYVGSAYNGLVYQLDPRTNRVKSLGSPSVDSTPWIFWLMRTQGGEIYGAKGVGLFRLDWKSERLEQIGLVPGNHRTPGVCSNPIVRVLVEDEDGVLWGDTNRWLFRFHPDTGCIEPIADMVAFDPATYALFLPVNAGPTRDLVFAVFARFSGAEVKQPFYVCRAPEWKIEPLPIEGLRERVITHPVWWQDGAVARLLVPAWDEATETASILVTDPLAGTITDRWALEGGPGELNAGPLSDDGRYFFSGRGLFRADPEQRRLVKLADNPTPAVCRCLAMSPRRKLGADTWDLGYAFTFDVAKQASASHGRVWIDDHRCNFGPAAFAGADGRYFLANHGQTTSVARLWVTDTASNRHWRAGPSAVQLVAFADGTVWGTEGPSIDSYSHTVWNRTISPGALFRYRPGEKQAERLEAAGEVGPLAEAPGRPGWPLASQGRELLLIRPDPYGVVQHMKLPDGPIAAAAGADRLVAYWALSDGSLHVVTAEADGRLAVVQVAGAFGPVDRGFFVLPRTSLVLGIAADGSATVYDPRTRSVMTGIRGPVPLPAGPAVDTEEDAWYYADQRIMRYALAER